MAMGPICKVVEVADNLQFRVRACWRRLLPLGIEVVSDARLCRVGESMRVDVKQRQHRRSQDGAHGDCAPVTVSPTIEEKHEFQTHPRRTCRALVLGGGGAFGSVQAAYIAAAAEAGFAPDVVVGTSVGSLNAVWVAMYPADASGLLDIWRGLDGRKVLEFHSGTVLRRLARRPLSIGSNTLVLELIQEYIGNRSFSDTRLPLAVTATNLSQGRKQVFRTGRLGDAILASTAIPGLFGPVELDGQLYVDGSLVAATDLATAVNMGATEILAIDLTAAASITRPRTAFGVLRRSFGIISNSATAAMEECLRLSMPVHVVRPDLSQLSPWRVKTDPATVRRYLDTARRQLAHVIGSQGSVIPAPVALDGAAPKSGRFIASIQASA